MMAMTPRCEECVMLRQQLDQAIAAENALVRPAEGEDLAAWIDRLDAEHAGRVRETSAVWKAWRKLVDHRARTGHIISVIPWIRRFESSN
jgi:hypothetical protein